MRPADAYRLKYRSSSQDSTEPLGLARALEPSRPTETNETAELRALALEADEIGRAARESRRRAAHMRLPPPHKLEELGLSSSGGELHEVARAKLEVTHRSTALLYGVAPEFFSCAISVFFRL